MSSFARLDDDIEDRRKSPPSSSQRSGVRRSIKLLSNPFSQASKLRRSGVGTDSKCTDTTQESSDKAKSPRTSIRILSQAENCQSQPSVTGSSRDNLPDSDSFKGQLRTRRASLSTSTPGQAERAPSAVPLTAGKRRSSLSNAPTTTIARRSSLDSAKTPLQRPAIHTAIALEKKKQPPRKQRRSQSLTTGEVVLPKLPIQSTAQDPEATKKMPSLKSMEEQRNEPLLAKQNYTIGPIASSSPTLATATKKKVPVRKTQTRQRSAPVATSNQYTTPIPRKKPSISSSNMKVSPQTPVSLQSPALSSEQSPTVITPRETDLNVKKNNAIRTPQRSPASQSNNSASKNNHKVQVRRASVTKIDEGKLNQSPETPSSSSRPSVKLNYRIDMSPGLPLRQTSSEGTSARINEAVIAIDDTEAWDDEEEVFAVELVERASFTQQQQQQQPPPPSQQALTPVYKYARQCQWNLVVEECDVNPRDSKFVNHKDGTTALHLAVMSRTNPAMRDGLIPGYDPAPLEVIEVLLMAAPEAAITRCSVKKYTPLHYACLVADLHYDMEDAANMIELFIKYAEHSPHVFTDDGFSALDVHILSYSRIHLQRGEEYSGTRTSTVVIKTLLKHVHSLAQARAYCNKIRSPVELLYRSNMDQFKEAASDHDNYHAIEDSSDFGAATLSSVTSKITEWWALKWIILLLKYADSDGSNIDNHRPFCALHAAARMVACPTPILSLLYQMNPTQIEDRDPRCDLYNLPLHEVCSWRCDKEIVCGDPFVARRKLRAIELLLDLHTGAARTTNNQSETPLQLAIESGTTWSGGISMLVRTCPKALKFPRKLRNVADINQNVLSVSLHNQALRNEREEEDFLRALEGMYPFMVAAVFARIPESRRRNPAFLYDGQTIEDHHLQIRRKELDSLMVVYGLLRTRPDALVRYRESRRAKKRSM